MKVLSKNTFYIETTEEFMEGTGLDCVVDYEFQVAENISHVIFLRPLGVPKEDGFIHYFNVKYYPPNITELILKTMQDVGIGFKFENYKTVHKCEDLVEQRG